MLPAQDMIQALIFDIDGTLLDSVDQHAEAWRLAFERFGFVFDFASIRSQIGKGGDKLLEEFLDPDEIKKRGKKLEKYRGDLFKEKFLSSCKPFPKVRELFQKLHDSGFKLALATSATKSEAEKYEEMLNIKDLVDARTTKDEVESSKPDPDVLESVRKLLGGLKPDECVFIGDSPFDAEAASKDKMDSFGVLCGGFPEADIRKAGAKEIFADPADLLARWPLER